MKKFILFSILSLLTTGYASSQISERSKSWMNTRHCKEIVRAYNYPEAIVFAFDTLYNGTFVSLKTNTGILKGRYIPNRRIHDFVISYDTVFFCGENNNKNGVIGFFDINDYFNHGGDCYVLDSLPIRDSLYVAKLTKLVTYFDEENRRHVFALGVTDHDELHERFGCVIDWLGYLGYTAYNAGYVYKSPERTFTDVDVVGNYVVTVGYDNLFGVDSRVFNKSNPFLATGPQNYAHRMEGNPANGYYQWNEVDALVTNRYSDINNNTFSIASIYKRNLGQLSTGWRVHLAELDVSSIVAHSPNTILTSRQLDASSFITPMKLHELRYNPIVKRYSILYRGKNLMSEEMRNIFVEMKDHFDTIVMAFRDTASIFGPDLNYVSYDQFTSIKKYIFAGNLLMETYYADLSERLYFQLETSGYQSFCLPSEKCVLSEVKNVKSNYIESPLISTGQRAVPLQLHHYWSNQFGIVIECSQMSDSDEN